MVVRTRRKKQTTLIDANSAAVETTLYRLTRGDSDTDETDELEIPE